MTDYKNYNNSISVGGSVSSFVDGSDSEGDKNKFLKIKASEFLTMNAGDNNKANNAGVISPSF